MLAPVFPGSETYTMDILLFLRSCTQVAAEVGLVVPVSQVRLFMGMCQAQKVQVLNLQGAFSFLTPTQHMSVTSIVTFYILRWHPT